jgi:kumamolisin
MNGERAAIEGSVAVHPSSAQRVQDVAPDTPVTVSIILKRRAPESDIAKQIFSPNFQPLSREDAARQLGADPSDVAAVEQFCNGNRLHVLSADAVSRTVKVQGTAANVEKAFGVKLGWYEGENGQRYISYDGAITVPQNVAGAIMAVTGLDNRPVARTREASSFQ